MFFPTPPHSISHAQQPTWSPDPTLASTSATLGSADEEDLSAYANKSALMAIAASTGPTLTGSDGSTVVANPAVVDVLDGPSPPVLAFGREGVSTNYGTLLVESYVLSLCMCYQVLMLVENS